MGGYIINYDGRSEWLKTRKEIEDSYEKGVEQGIELGIDKGVAKGRSEERDRILEYLSASGKFTENEIQEFLERFPLAEQN